MNIQHKSGLTSELKAASYFASEGYEIYWPMCTQSRCDFVVFKNEYFSKVQIKTATWSKTGEHLYLQCRLTNRNGYSTSYIEGDFDWIVFVDGDRMWVAGWDDVDGLTSVCLDCTNPDYKPNKKTYDPNSWLVTKDED